MSTIYEKMKAHAEKKRRSFVSLGSEDGAVSPTKLNQTLVDGSKGLSKPFYNPANDLMDGFNSTVNETGMSYGEDLASDGDKLDFGSGNKSNAPSVVEFSSPAKNANKEAAEKLKSTTTRTKREGDFSNEAGNAVDVTDVITLTPGNGFEDSGEKMSNEDYTQWKKDNPDWKEKEDAYVEKKEGAKDKEDKSVEITERPTENKEVTETPGTKSQYNMGLMETRNAKKARNKQLRSNKKLTKKYEKLIKKHEKTKGNNSESERMSPELRDAYAHFSEEGSSESNRFNQRVGTTKGVDTKATSEEKVTAGFEAGAEGATVIDASGNPVENKKDEKSIAEFKAAPSVTKFAGVVAGALGKAAIGMAADKLTGGPKYKMRGPLYKNNKK